jgi:hypothetical protein
MRRLAVLALFVAVLFWAGCSAPNDLTTPMGRSAQAVSSGRSPALAFQLNTFLCTRNTTYGPAIPLDVPLGALGLTPSQIIDIFSGASIVNADCPLQDVDVPEWDEWLLSTLDVDVPEWDEWLTDVDVPEWDEWLNDVDVPEWDEWLISFGTLPQYRSNNWMAWAAHGPAPIVDVDVPEWDEWLVNITLRQAAKSYDAWWTLVKPSSAMR